MLQTQSEMTQRELVEFAQQKEMFEKQAELTVKLKELDIQHLTLESRFNAWFRVPVVIIKLPVYLLFGVAYCIHAVRGSEPSESFWDFIK